MTDLQYLVLDLLETGGQTSGRDLRQKLAERGHKMSGPAFYLVMARLGEAGMVEYQDIPKQIEGVVLAPRHFTITALGSQVQATHSLHR